MRTALRAVSALLATALLPASAFAHTGVGAAGGFGHGFMHPIGGLDHILAMVAVGMFAARLGGRALWLVPAAFVGMMAMGGLAGVSGVSLAFVEIGIAASVLVLGLAVAFRWSLPVAAAMALVGFFAVFHGHAHGSEMPASASGLAYGLGFMLATALLHAAGIALGLGFGRMGERSRLAFQAGGGAMALAGLGLLAGVL
jgi:urease accessory protein